MTHYCPLCELRLPDQAHFCRQCGHELRTTHTIDDTTNIGSPSVYVELPDVSTGSQSAATRTQKVLSRLARFVQRFIVAVLIRAKDPKPERPGLNRQNSLGSQ